MGVEKYKNISLFTEACPIKTESWKRFLQEMFVPANVKYWFRILKSTL